MWHVRRWLFWETITVSHVCCYSVNHSNGEKCTLNCCVNGSIWQFKFPKVVQAHTLGEVDILGKVLLKVSSGTILTIFNEIGSYLTERERERERAKNKLAQFFETRCILHGSWQRRTKRDPRNTSALHRSKLWYYVLFAVCGPKFTQLRLYAQSWVRVYAWI